MNRDEAIEVLREIAGKEGFTLDWISLVNGVSGCEIHIKADQNALSIIKPIFDEHCLKLRKINDRIILYREHKMLQEQL